MNEVKIKTVGQVIDFRLLEQTLRWRKELLKLPEIKDVHIDTCAWRFPFENQNEMRRYRVDCFIAKKKQKEGFPLLSFTFFSTYTKNPFGWSSQIEEMYELKVMFEYPKTRTPMGKKIEINCFVKKERIVNLLQQMISVSESNSYISKKEISKLISDIDYSFR